MKIKLLIILALVISFIAGKYSGPSEVKKEVITETKTDIKKEDNKNIVIETEEVLAKCDPTSQTQPIKKTKITDLSNTVIVSQNETRKKEKEEIKNKPQWIIGGGYGYNTNKETIYSAEINTRVFSLPVFVGVQGTTTGRESSAMIKLMMEF